VRLVSPVMAEEFHVFFDDEAAAIEGAAVIDAVRSGDEQVFSVRRTGSDVFVGCRFFTARPLAAPLDHLLYWTEAPREGTHHPDGILWIGTGPSAQGDVRAPLTAVAPTILALLDLDPAPSMRAEPLLARSTT
jgi:predicted AlkP superfamily phosphohydrolase/phosphomutase